MALSWKSKPLLAISILVWALLPLYIFTRPQPAPNIVETTPLFPPTDVKKEAQMQFDYGWRFYNQKDFVKAAEHYLKSADAGYAPAQYNIGAMYAAGQGISRDYIEAYKWFFLAIGQGLTKAVESRDLISRHMKAEHIAEAKRRAGMFVVQQELRQK